MEHSVGAAEEPRVALQGGDDDLGLKALDAADEPAKAILVELGRRVIQQQGRQQAVLALEVFELAKVQSHGRELLLAAREHLTGQLTAQPQGHIGAMGSGGGGVPFAVAGGRGGQGVGERGTAIPARLKSERQVESDEFGRDLGPVRLQRDHHPLTARGQALPFPRHLRFPSPDLPGPTA